MALKVKVVFVGQALLEADTTEAEPGQVVNIPDFTKNPIKIAESGTTNLRQTLNSMRGFYIR